MLKLLDI